MRWSLVGILSLTGLVMGLVTSLIGLPQAVEMGTWIAFYVGWGAMILRSDSSPFLTALTASLLSGVWTGVTQFLLWDSYVESNPWYAEQIAAAGGEANLGAIVGFALAMGLIWGVLVGGVCWGIARRRAGGS